MLDKKCGEWFWGVYEDHSPMIGEDKAGLWKCPYHNSRACMEIIRRINSILNNGSI
jgi:mannobiose 2-epimerase